MTTQIGSILLASTDPDRLRRWYADAFDVEPDVDGHLLLGPAVIVVSHDGVADRTVEPGRVLLNFHVASIQDAAARMDELRAPWVAGVEYRDAGLWFGTVEDPDGNYVQLIEETPAYAPSSRRSAPAPPDSQEARGATCQPKPADTPSRRRRVGRFPRAAGETRRPDSLTP